MKTLLVALFFFASINAVAQKRQIRIDEIPTNIVAQKDSLFAGTEIIEAWDLGKGDYQIKHHYDSLVYINSFIDSKSLWLSMQDIDLKNIPFTILKNKAFPLLYLNPGYDQFYLIQTNTGFTFYRLKTHEYITVGKDSIVERFSTIDFDLNGNSLEQFITY